MLAPVMFQNQKRFSNQFGHSVGLINHCCHAKSFLFLSLFCFPSLVTIWLAPVKSFVDPKGGWKGCQNVKVGNVCTLTYTLCIYFHSKRCHFYLAVVICYPPSSSDVVTFRPIKETYEFREVVQYTCQKDYTLSGSISLACSENGTFQPNPPTCVSKCFNFFLQPFPNIIPSVNSALTGKLTDC